LRPGEVCLVWEWASAVVSRQHWLAHALLSTQGDTPLHAAAQHAGADMIELLLAENCNPLVENLLVSYTKTTWQMPCKLHR